MILSSFYALIAVIAYYIKNNIFRIHQFLAALLEEYQAKEKIWFSFL